MKNVEISKNESWTSLDISELHDDSLSFDQRTIDPVDGIKLKSSFAQQHCVDTVTDEHSSMILTNQVQINDIIDINLPGQQYPEQFTTSLLANAYPSVTNNSAYLYIFEKDEQDSQRDHLVGVRTSDLTMGEHVYPSTSKQTYRWAQDTVDNAIYYTVTLHDEQLASVNHNDNTNNVYMTAKMQQDGQTVLIVFEQPSNETPGDEQFFNYYINKDYGYIIFYKKINNTTYYVTPVTDNAGVLLARSVEYLNPLRYPPESVFKYIPYSRNTTVTTLQNSWASYQTTGDTNNLNINPTKSYDSVTNNYLIVSQHKNIQDNLLRSDVIQLKNQLNINNRSNRNNPFPNLRDVDHREYDQILTSDHIDAGTGLNLNYNSYETEIILEPDRVTYFNSPQHMFPYDRININDSGLIQSGAIGGDTPINSDKIFKKAASYKYNTPNGAPSDEDTGVWLCSWLKSNIGVDWNDKTLFRVNVIVNYDNTVYKCVIENTGLKPNINPDEWEEIDSPPPVWVDRYYNPEKFSSQKALEIEGQYSSYVTKFETVVDLLGAQDQYIFDKTSDLTFEPGCLYAYYRIGESQIDTIINSNNESMIHDGIIPAYDQDRNSMTNINDEVLFDHDQYIETTTPANITNSDFTISFQMHRDDWSTPFAGQMLGNYTNQGVGVFNKQNITPYIILRTDHDVRVYNTSMTELYSLPVSSTNSFTKLTGNEDLMMFDSVSATSYDMKGMLVESTMFDVSAIVDATVDDNFYYILDDQNNIHRYNIQTEVKDQLNRAYPYDTVIGSIEHAASISDITWEQSDNTYIRPVDDGDLQFRINCDHFTIDNYNSVWFSKGNRVFRYSLSNRLGVNATWQGIVGAGSSDTGQSEVQLIAEENFKGSDGNDIELQGDGVKTIFTLITEWNNVNRDNKVNLIRGNSSVVLTVDDYIKLDGGVDRGSSSTTQALSAEFNINGIKCDYDNNIIVLYDDTKVVKMDNLRNILFQVDLKSLDTSLSEKAYTEVYFDMITEVSKDFGYNTYCIVLLKDDQGVTHYIKLNVDDDFTIREKNEIDLSDVNLSNQVDVTCFELYRQLCRKHIQTNDLIFQFKYQSYFDTDKFKIMKLVVNIDDFSSGYHHFAFSFNSANSNLSLFVDGVLTDAQSSDDEASGAAFKYSRSIHDPLLVGSEPFFNNITFSERVGIDYYGFSGDYKIRKYRVYNEYLNFQKIKMLSREQQEVRSINLTLPCGKRNHIDHATKFYKHREPGQKSNAIDIDITTNTAGTTELQQYIQQQLKEIVDESLPANTSINNINWIT